MDIENILARILLRPGRPRRSRRILSRQLRTCVPAGAIPERQSPGTRLSLTQTSVSRLEPVPRGVETSLQ